MKNVNYLEGLPSKWWTENRVRIRDAIAKLLWSELHDNIQRQETEFHQTKDDVKYSTLRRTLKVHIRDLGNINSGFFSWDIPVLPHDAEKRLIIDSNHPEYKVSENNKINKKSSRMEEKEHFVPVSLTSAMIIIRTLKEEWGINISKNTRLFTFEDDIYNLNRDIILGTSTVFVSSREHQLLTEMQNEDMLKLGLHHTQSPEQFRENVINNSDDIIKMYERYRTGQPYDESGIQFRTPDYLIFNSRGELITGDSSNQIIMPSKWFGRQVDTPKNTKLKKQRKVKTKNPLSKFTD
tara:strand:+ start:203 stop:1084 length:882 start_codon:yes stop_codon:yes gene_type:complete